jgi:cell cycle sensor histidine kinase DivJ
MPNRPDQSVKTSRRDHRKPVNSYRLLGGILLAGLGALAVTLSGERLGVLVGLAVFTILIGLQIFSLFTDARQSPAPSRPMSQTGAREVEPNAPNRDQILILNISELGRVRSIWGQRDYLNGVRIGAIAEKLVPPGHAELDASVDGERVRLRILRFSTGSGELIILAPTQGGVADVSDAVLERTNFFAGLGHDLKSPLNAVIGFADVMDAEIRGPMPDAYKDYPGLIRESGETLLRLVEDMLGYARSETGAYELDLAPMDIAASGESVMRQSQAVADKAGIGLRMICDREVLALADAGAVRRIWDNLVSNAIKYSAAGDTVTLLSDVKHDQAIIQVRDTGTGMDADDLARIASPFSQGRNAKGRAGTGLGLALVHRLAEMQGGKVQIETAPGAGTTVTVTIPALSESQKRAAE